MTGTNAERTTAEKTITADRIGVASPDTITCGRIVWIIQRAQRGTSVMTEEGCRDKKTMPKKEAGQAVAITATMKATAARTLLNWWQTLATRT